MKKNLNGPDQNSVHTTPNWRELSIAINSILQLRSCLQVIGKYSSCMTSWDINTTRSPRFWGTPRVTPNHNCTRPACGCGNFLATPCVHVAGQAQKLVHYSWENQCWLSDEKFWKICYFANEKHDTRLRLIRCCLSVSLYFRHCYPNGSAENQFSSHADGYHSTSRKYSVSGGPCYGQSGLHLPAHEHRRSRLESCSPPRSNSVCGFQWAFP